MPFPKGRELIQLFLDGIDSYPEFKVKNKANPLLLSFNGRSYMLFFKCISYAGNPYPRNTTRAQLPCRAEFETLKASDTFLFLGYDTDNDLYVCWDPVKTRLRLNQKSYVSFFCRQSLQNSIKEGEIKSGKLTNGDVFVLFKRCDISSFFEMLELYFPFTKEDNNQIKTETNTDSKIESVDGILDRISEDPSVRLLVDKLLSDNETKLSIISECMNQYGPFYYKMRFLDWADIINKYINKHSGDDI